MKERRGTLFFRNTRSGTTALRSAVVPDRVFYFKKDSLARRGDVAYGSNSRMNADSFQYALENTQVILAPQRRIETFGSTSFHFYLVTELMDSVNQVRVRDGKIHAERPQIMTPDHYSTMLLEGFGEKAQAFADWIRTHSDRFAFLKYGFQFRKTDIKEAIVYSSVEETLDRVRLNVTESEEPLSAILTGVDDAWEVCLLKFTMDLIQQSAGGNFGDFRKRGLL